MPRAVSLLCLVIMGLLSGFPVRADHDVPYYPSFYPQEIRLDTVDPTAAALLLHGKELIERQLVSVLTSGCERVVVGYTLRREFYNKAGHVSGHVPVLGCSHRRWSD